MALKILQRSGKWIRTYCPYCQCDDLWIDEMRGSGHCFQCGVKTGTKKLKKQFGLELPVVVEAPAQKPVHETEPTSLDIAEAKRYLTSIWNDLPYRVRRPYIDSSRFRLTSADALRKRIQSDLCESDAIRFGFRYRSETGVQWVRALSRRRIVIPYFREGKLVDIRTRGEGTKYLHIKGWPSTFWGELHCDPVIVTEGEFKAMRLEQLGYNALAVPGIASCHDKLVHYLHTKECKHAIIWFDTEPQWDHPVYDQMKKLQMLLSERGIRSMCIQPAPAMLVTRKVDVEDVITCYGKPWLDMYLALVIEQLISDDLPPSGTFPLSL